MHPVLVCVGIVGDGEEGGAVGDGDGEGVVLAWLLVVGGSDGVDAGGGGSGCGSVGGAGVVVGQCWVASCSGWTLAWVSGVLWWVVESLVLPTVSPLVLGVVAGEGVAAFGLVVGGGAGVGVAVTGPGFGRGWLGVAGRGRSPLLAEGLVGLPLCPSGVSGGFAAPPVGLLGSCSLGFRVLCVFVVRAVRALWCVVCVCGARVGGGCGGVCCVHAWAWVRCVGGAFGCLSSPFWLGLAAWCGCGGCVLWPLSRPRRGVRVRFPASPGWGLLVVVCPPVAPFACPPPLSPCRVAGGGVPLVLLPGCGGWGGGSLTLARFPSPGVSPWGGRCLHSPSGCNSVVRAVHLYPLGTNGPAP